MNADTKTSVIKISEFEEITSILIEYGTENCSSLIELIGRQTQAKQNKFWKFYDAKVGA